MNNIYKKPKYITNNLKGSKPFEGMSIEREIEQWQINGVPIQRSITNMYYTPRKYGVVEETDIRTDKWQLAQNAMEKVNQDFKKRIKDKLEQSKTQETKAE